MNTDKKNHHRAARRGGPLRLPGNSRGRARAKVTVLISARSVPNRRLADFRSLQQSVALTPSAAEKWIRVSAAERKAFGEP